MNLETMPPPAGVPDAAPPARGNVGAHPEPPLPPADPTRELGRRVLLSAAFAEAAGARCESLGAHRLRGVGVPVEVFAPC